MLKISYITSMQQTLNPFTDIKSLFRISLYILLLSEDFLSFTSSLLERVANSPLSSEPLSDTRLAGGSNLLILINVKMSNIVDKRNLCYTGTRLFILYMKIRYSRRRLT